MPPTYNIPTGHTTAKGNVSVKMGPGRTFKRYMKIETAVRLEVIGLSDKDIAAHMGITVPGLNFIKRSPEYQSKRVELATGVLSETDKDMRESEEMMRAELKAMVPVSLATYRQTLIAGSTALATVAQRKLALQVAQDVMDREGTIAKISRTKVEHVDTPALPASVGLDLLAALNAASEARISGDSSVMDVFKKAAGLSADSLEELHRNIKLEDFNADGKSVQ